MIKLTRPARLSFQDPLCDACCVSVTSSGDGWMCPKCGTFWEYSAGEDEPGTLYEDWSGEELEDPAIEPEHAWEYLLDRDREKRKGI